MHSRIDVRLPSRAAWAAALIVLIVAAWLSLAPGNNGWSRRGEDPIRLPAGAFVPSIEGRSATVWAVGDGATGEADAIAVARLIARSRVDRFLYLGDVYERGTAADFANHYAPVYGRLASVTAPTPGNHDWPRHAEGYDPYWRRIHGKFPPAFYSFRVAGWQILSLNSEAPHGPDSAQLEWMRRQVRRPGTCRIAFWHRPRYSAGTRHGDQPDVAPLWNALHGRARIVLAGHEHDMQRMRPRDGIVEFVSGAGGRKLYEIERGYPGLAFGNDDDYGALRLELRPRAARYAFVRADGRVLDSGVISCKPVAEKLRRSFRFAAPMRLSRAYGFASGGGSWQLAALAGRFFSQ